MFTFKTFMLLLIFSLLTICFYSALRMLNEAISRKRIAFVAGRSNQSSGSFRIVQLCEKVFFKLAKKLLHCSFVSKGANNIVILVSMRGLRTNCKQVVSCLIGCACSIFLIGILLSRSLLFGISLGLIVFAGALIISGSRLHRATCEMREQVPDAIQCMSNCSASGFSLMQTFEQAEKECVGALEKTFSLAHRRLKLGASIEEALGVFDNVKTVPELKFISIAFRVQHVAGGPISEVLECARDSVLSELDLARTLRVQTTQAKLSATIVTLMPFFLLALFSFMSPGFLAPFFSSLIGAITFCLAVAMQVFGVLLVRKTLSRCEV